MDDDLMPSYGTSVGDRFKTILVWDIAGSGSEESNRGHDIVGTKKMRAWVLGMRMPRYSWAELEGDKGSIFSNFPAGSQGTLVAMAGADSDKTIKKEVGQAMAKVEVVDWDDVVGLDDE